ncbi:hypothetical protein BVY04_02260 [bacterium M21]|nr:hypothetical protein BVY04_02260 [bacterium M21]
MRQLPILLLLIVGLASSGCCIFRCNDGVTPGIDQLIPSKHPIAIANQITTDLQANMFHDETATYTLYIEPNAWNNSQALELTAQLRRKLAQLSNVRLVYTPQQAYLLRVVIPPDATPQTAVFELLSATGTTIWTHREQLQKDPGQ